MQSSLNCTSQVSKLTITTRFTNDLFDLWSTNLKYIVYTYTNLLLRSLRKCVLQSVLALKAENFRLVFYFLHQFFKISITNIT